MLPQRRTTRFLRVAFENFCRLKLSGPTTTSRVEACQVRSGQNVRPSQSPGSRST